MNSGETSPENCPAYLALLDDLILEMYRKVRSEIQENPPKLGDLLKMIEMRLKATPATPKHQRFWKMLEEIRKNTLPSDSKSQSVQAGNKTKREKK